MELINNTIARRFELQVGEHQASLEYDERDGMIDLQYVEVPPAIQHRGYATELARVAVEYARSKGLRVVASCSFIRAYIQRHLP
ncbi:MAG: GNAT family N-acetyltransferase [Gemmatimonadaceae bacterium]